MSDIAEHVVAEQCFALEFEERGLNRFMSVRFWKDQHLCELPATGLTGDLRSLSRLLSLTSTKIDVVACSGGPADLIRTINQSPNFTRSTQAVRFEQLDLPHLLNKMSYSVFGHIELFSVLRGLLISLGGSQTEDWVLRSPEQAKVSVPSIHLNEIGQTLRGTPFRSSHLCGIDHVFVVNGLMD